jgi:hypothetical protein
LRERILICGLVGQMVLRVRHRLSLVAGRA